MIGLSVNSAPRDGVALLKFLVDVAKGNGGKIVEELLAAEAKLAKMEADANARLSAREAELSLIKEVNDKAMQARVDEANARVEAAQREIEQARKELEQAVRTEQAKLDRADQALEEKRLALVARVAEVEAASKLADERMAAAEKLNARALSTERRYEAWLANVEAVKV